MSLWRVSRRGRRGRGKALRWTDRFRPPVVTADPTSPLIFNKRARAVSRRREQTVQLKRLWVPGLTGPDGATLDAKHVDVNQVGFVNKVHPDPLFPMPHGQPEWQDVPFGENAIFWITVDVPHELEPGTYTGAVKLQIDQLIGRSVDLGGGHTLPIELNVSPVVLPKRTNVATMNVRLGGGGMSMYARASDDPVGYVKKLFELLADHRMSADKPWPLYNRLGMDFDPYSEAGAAKLEKWCRWWAERGLYIGALPGIPVNNHESIEEAIRAWDRHIGSMIRENGWEDRAHILFHGSVADGKRIKAMLPNIRIANNSTGEGWSAFRAWYQQDEQTMARWGEKWSKWNPVLDIWNERPRLTIRTIPHLHARKERLMAAGDEIVWYWHSVSPVAMASLATRDFMWRMFREGATGTVFWGALMWHAGRDVDTRPFPRGWQDRRVWRLPNGFAAPRIAGADVGNGLLMWPGREGPLGSLRMANYRDGVEDYDLLVLLRQRLNQLEQAGGHDQLLQRARALLEVPDELLTDSQKPYPINWTYRSEHYQPTIPHQKRFEQRRRDVVHALEQTRAALGVADD